MEEEIIRRRLLTQTAVGHRGDPPLTKLTKHYLQFCNAAVSALKGGGGESQAKLEEMAEEAFRGVANIELLGQKQEAICAAHRADGAAFVEKRAALEAEVEAARRDIEARKVANGPLTETQRH